jgi:ureidoacrylate peracid hydrolase
MELKGKTALIVVDMQNGFCSPEGFMAKIGLDYETSAEAIGPIRRLLDASRDAGLPIFFTRYSLSADYSDAGLLLELFPGIRDAGGMIRDTWDAAIVDELTPREDEVALDKIRYSAFYKTDLEDRLRELGVETLIVCGVTTNICVESTVRDAFFRDIRVVVPSDATAAVTPELHEGALNDFRYGFGDVVTVAEIEEALRARAKAGAR